MQVAGQEDAIGLTEAFTSWALYPWPGHSHPTALLLGSGGRAGWGSEPG